VIFPSLREGQDSGDLSWTLSETRFFQRSVSSKFLNIDNQTGFSVDYERREKFSGEISKACEIIR